MENVTESVALMVHVRYPNINPSLMERSVFQ